MYVLLPLNVRVTLISLLHLLPTATLFTLALFHDTLPSDHALLRTLSVHHEPLRDFFAWFDINPVASLSMTASLWVVCLARRQLSDALAVLLILPAQGLVIVLPKLFVGRPRPEGALFGHTDSFPSGTAATAVLILGLTIHLAGLYITRKPLRITLQVALSLAIPALGIFRLLSGEHYPSDVLSGWLAGTLSLLAIIAFHRRLRLRSATPGPP